MPDRPDWLNAPHKDAQGPPRRVITAPTQQALAAYAQKVGKLVEQQHSETLTAMIRSGQVLRPKQVTRWYGLLSA